jgi:hypothetical protein
MIKRFVKILTLASFAILLLAPGKTFAQAICGDLTGVVSGPTGATILSATAEVTNQETGIKNSTAVGSGD